MSEEKPAVELDWRELAAIIFASRGITSGLWRLAVKMRFAALNMRFPENINDVNNVLTLPTSVAAIEKIALFSAQTPGPMIFDAAELLSQAKLRDKPAAKAKPAAVKTAKAKPVAVKSVKRS